MSVSDFSAQTREHTFTSSGRTVLVRQHLQYMHLMSRMQRDDEEGLADMFAAWTGGGEIDAANITGALRLNDVLIQEFVDMPRVLIPQVDDPGVDDGYGSVWCWINDFTDDELAELIDLASQGVSRAHRFPGDAGVDADDGDGEGVADAAKPAPRPKKRKR